MSYLYGTWVIPQSPRLMESHGAKDNLTGYASRRARAEARCTAPRARWLSPGIPRVPALCRRPHADGDGDGVVLLARQCLSHRPPLAREAAGRHSRHGRPTRRTRPHHGPAALAQALLGCLAQGPPAGLGVGSHALELCHIGARTPRQTWPGRVRVAGAALAPCIGREVDTGQAGGHRERSAARRTLGPASVAY